MYMKAPTTEGEHFSAKLRKRVSEVLNRGRNLCGKKEESVQNTMFNPEIHKLYSIS
jgi:hypothetical protein